MALFGEINCARASGLAGFPHFLRCGREIRERRAAHGAAVSYQFNRTDITIVSRLTLARTIFEFFAIRSKDAHRFNIDFPRGVVFKDIKVDCATAERIVRQEDVSRAKYLQSSMRGIAEDLSTSESHIFSINPVMLGLL